MSTVQHPCITHPPTVIYVSSTIAHVQVLKLVAEHLLCWDEGLMRQWGDVLWRGMSDSYVRLHAGPFVRAQPDDSAAIDAKLQAAIGLEEFAESLGIVEGACMEPRALNAYPAIAVCLSASGGGSFHGHSAL